MSITSGFFNSQSGDRRYSTEQFSSLFDGLIADGVFETVGNAFYVEATGGQNVRVDTGKAWFNHTWTINDAWLGLSMPAAEQLYKRIDAIVLDIDSREEVRANNIIIVTGTPASNPSRPSLISSEYRNQHAIAYITRPSLQERASGDVLQSDIAFVVGTSETPFVTGIIDTIDISNLLTRYDQAVATLIAQLEQNISDASSAIVPDLSVTTGKIAANAVTRAKLADDAAYSPVVSISTDTTLTADMLGKTLRVSGSNITITIPTSLFNTSTYGFWEIAVLSWNSVTNTTIKVEADSGKSLIHTENSAVNGKATISEQRVMCAFKLITNASVYVTGDCEVAVQ